MPEKVRQDILFSAGLDLKSSDELLEPTAARVMENVLIDEYDVPSKLYGYVDYNPSDLFSGTVTSMKEFNTSDGTRAMLAIDSTGDIKRTTGDGFWSLIESGLNTSQAYEFAVARDRAYYMNKVDTRSTDGTTARPMGLEPPPQLTLGTTPAQNLEVIGGGSITSGVYSYAITYVYDNFQESSRGPGIDVTLNGSQQTRVDLSGLTIPDGVTDIRIYRTVKDAGTTASHRLVDEVSLPLGAGPHYTDNTTDALLGTDTAAIDVLPLVAGGDFLGAGIPVWYANRMWLAQTVEGADRVYVSDPFSPDKFREEQYFIINEADGGSITAIHPFRDSLLVWKRTSFNVIRGVFGSLDNMLPDTIALDVGCVDYRSVKTITRNGVMQVVFGDKEKLYTYDGTNLVDLTTSIEPLWRGLGQVNAFRGQDTQTTQADFLAGTSSPSIDLTTQAGSIGTLEPSKTWDLDADWNAGTIEHTGFITVSGDTLKYDFPGWSIFGGATWNLNNQFNPILVSPPFGFPAEHYVGRASNHNTENWQFAFGSTASPGGTNHMYFMSDSLNPGAMNGYELFFAWPTNSTYNITFRRKDAGVPSGSLITGSGGVGDNIRIERVGGTFELFVNEVSQGTAADSTYSDGDYLMFSVDFASASLAGSLNFSIGQIGDGTENVTWTSEVIDTRTDRAPDWSDLVVTGEFTGTGSITYRTRSGPTPTPDGSWTAFSDLVPGPIGEPLGNQYHQLQIDMASNNVAETLTVGSARTGWDTIATHEGYVVDTNLPSGPNGWDTFFPVIQDAGTGITFEFRSGPTAVPDGSWTAYTAVPAGTIPTVALDQYYQWKATLTAEPGNLPVINSVLTQWFTGSPSANRLTTIFFRDLLYIAAQTDPSSASNDILLIQDNKGRWTTADIAANSMEEYFDTLFFSEIDSGRVLKFDTNKFTRSGAPVTSTIESGNKPWTEAQLNDNRKLLRALRLSTTSAEDFTLSVNPDEAGFVPAITVPGGQSRYVPLNTSARRHKIRIEHSGTGDFQLWKISPELHVYKVRRGVG